MAPAKGEPNVNKSMVRVTESWGTTKEMQCATCPVKFMSSQYPFGEREEAASEVRVK